MNEPRKIMPDVYFVISTDEKSILLSCSAIYEEKDRREIYVENVANETGSKLEVGDKIIANLQSVDGSSRLTIKKIIARQQPIATSDKEYLRLLTIYINDEKQFLDFQELNSILEAIIGIKVLRINENSRKDHDVIIDIDDEDSGTKPCPFVLPAPPSSYPLRVHFPRVTDATKKYLKMICPDGKVTETRIFAFRLMHFLLHRLGYHVHINLQADAEYKRLRKAIHEGDPSQVPVIDVTNVCLCDCELIHFVAVQSNSIRRSFESMICDLCRKSRMPTGVGLDDFEALLNGFLESVKPPSHSRTEKRIFYVIESREVGLILNESPYKSRITINVAHKDWINITFDSYEKLHNIFIPNELFHKPVELRKGDKILLNIKTQSTLKEGTPKVSLKAASFEIDRVIKRQVKIINASNLLSKIIPFRLGVTLKIGPDMDFSFVKNVGKIVSQLTGWHVEIDKSSYQELKNSFSNLNNVYQEWKTGAPTDKSRLVAKAREIVDGLVPKKYEVEDSFRIIVYLFPEKYAFIEDVFGTTAFGEALYRIFAVVRIYPNRPPEYETQEPCKGCQVKPIIPLREQITALFVVHEVLHIASGLDDHRGCSSCSYGRREMQPLRRFYCEECIREGNDATQANCLMSYDCLLCASTRLSKTTVSQLLCEKCKRKLLPTEQFVSRQAARLNSIIYQDLLEVQS